VAAFLPLILFLVFKRQYISSLRH